MRHVVFAIRRPSFSTQRHPERETDCLSRRGTALLRPETPSDSPLRQRLAEVFPGATETLRGQELFSLFHDELEFLLDWRHCCAVDKRTNHAPARNPAQGLRPFSRAHRRFL